MKTKLLKKLRAQAKENFFIEKIYSYKTIHYRVANIYHKQHHQYGMFNENQKNDALSMLNDRRRNWILNKIYEKRQHKLNI